MDTSISIIQYFKNGTISTSTEIANVKANLDVNIRVQKFLMNSVDYQILNKEILRKKAEIDSENNRKRKMHLFDELNQLLSLEKEFILDILQLADVFSRMYVKTERLERAITLFDEGKIREADASLIESELSNDQFNLLIQLEYLEKRRDSFLNQEFNENQYL